MNDKLPPAVAEHLLEENEKLRALLREIRPTIPRDVLELWCKDRDAALAQQAEPVEPATAPEGLVAALFNAIEAYEDTRKAFVRPQDKRIHAEQCQVLSDHAYTLLAASKQKAEPALAKDERVESYLSALEQFECEGETFLRLYDVRDLIAELQARPAQTEQQPIGWRDPKSSWSTCSAATKAAIPDATLPFTDPLYAAPVAQTELVEAREMLRAAAGYATKMEPMSAKLLNRIDDWLEKNAALAQPAKESE